MATKAEETYKTLMEKFPKPGGGGAHQAFFKAGVLGYRAGKGKDEVLIDVAKALPEGGRPVSEAEIETGVYRGWDAAMFGDNGVKCGSPVKPPRINREALERLVSPNRGITAADIMAKSPVPLDFPETEASWRALELLFKPDDNLFIGRHDVYARPGVAVCPAQEWVKRFKEGGPTFPHIIINPLDGLPAPVKLDPARTTFRGDNNVVRWDMMVVEMDETPLADQLAFWAVIALPVCALVMSGGKSIHGWVRVNCADRDEWDRVVENDIFPSFLVPLGADPLCRNESRLSRLPGHIRGKDENNSGAVQKLIYLSPEGKAVCK